MNISDYIRVVPDFPKPGIQFYDIATLLADPAAWKETIAQLRQKIEPYQPDFLMGIDARGFLVAAPLALEMSCGFGMIRKKGRLPGETISQGYGLEYGTDEIELQPDIITQGAKVVLLDDLLATGGTIEASIKLIERAGGEVSAVACIIELEGLGGRERVPCAFEALLKYPA